MPGERAFDKVLGFHESDQNEQLALGWPGPATKIINATIPPTAIGAASPTV